MSTRRLFTLLIGMCLAVIAAHAQNPTVQNGVATYHSNKNIGRKFKVPDSWDKIIIKKNVTITGSFYMPTRTHPIEIAGESRVTSIIKGDGSRPTNDGINGRSYSAIRCDKSPDLFIHDLRSLNPMKFHIHGGFGNVRVERCDIIENRGEHSSDGIHGGSVIIIDCYIDTWDDAMYISDCERVENCTIIHNKNGSPFQISWGAGIGSNNYCLIKNCVVIDAYDKNSYNQGVVSWAQKHNSGEKQTMNVEFVNFKHQVRNGKAKSHMYQFGRHTGGINNAHIKVTGYCEEQNSVKWNGSTNSTISFDCSNPCQQTPGSTTVSKTDAGCGNNNGTITFTFDDDPNRTSIEMSIDGGTNYTNVGDNSGSYTFSNLPEGTYNCWVRWGNDDCPTDLGNITIGCIGNLAPVANAGPDQTVHDTDENGSEIVTLDGSASSDSDGTITSYVWTKSGTQIATGVSPSVTLSVGTHIVTLTVTDNDGATDTDNVTITVSSGCLQCPYAANTVPGTIEAEEYDLGGQGIAYSDTDAANKGNAGFRTDEGVDLDLRSGLISIGWCAANEWTEYSLDVQQTGTYKVFYTFATNANSNPKSFSFAINGSSIGTVNIAGNDPINSVGNSVFETRELGDIQLTAGTNILRWTAGSNAISFDKVEFEYQTPADITPPTVPTGLSATGATETTVDLSWNASTDSESRVAGYRVYQDGQQVADVTGLSTTISSLVCDNTYSFSVSAYDNAGNESAESAAELATTSACAPVGDYIYIGHIASGNRLGASAGNVDTRPASNTGANVQWEEVATNGGYFYLVNVATGEKLNAPTKRTINMAQASTSGNTAQWQWVAQGGGEYFLQSREWGKYFHIAADGVSDISTKWNANNPNIVWTITAVPKSAEATILTDNAVNIYPNPASSFITIELEEIQAQANISIFATSGRLIQTNELHSDLEQIDVSSLESGLYILKVQNGASVVIKSLSIE